MPSSARNKKSSGRSVTVVEHNSKQVAVLFHDPAVLEDPGLLESVTSAAQLAVSNARFLCEGYGDHRDLHSFPTRRSSDLGSVDRLTCPVHGPAEVVNGFPVRPVNGRSEEHTSELQSRVDLVCRLLLEKKKKEKKIASIRKKKTKDNKKKA